MKMAILDKAVGGRIALFPERAVVSEMDGGSTLVIWGSGEEDFAEVKQTFEETLDEIETAFNFEDPSNLGPVGGP